MFVSLLESLSRNNCSEVLFYGHKQWNKSRSLIAPMSFAVAIATVILSIWSCPIGYDDEDADKWQMQKFVMMRELRVENTIANI